MGRKPNPNTRYRVYLHQDKAGKYRYASVQVPKTVSSDTKRNTKIVHLGTVDENMTFTPNADFRLMDVAERVKYIFPDDWDTSILKAMNAEDYVKKDILEAAGVSLDSQSQLEQKTGANTKKVDSLAKEAPPDSVTQTNADSGKETAVPHPSDSYLDQYNNKLYGSFWLLDQIAENEGLYEDLVTVFRGNISKVNEVLSLAFYPYLSTRNFNRFSKWQRTHETLLEYPLPAPAITKLTQSITESDRMNLIKLRIGRLPEGAAVDCDSTTRSAWGSCLAEIHWGHNKDNEKLRNTLEVYVYSLTTHQPIYYRSFAGNASDMSTVRTVLKDLLSLGMKEVVFTADRGYCSDENIASLVAADLPFLLCAKVGSIPVIPLLRSIEYDSDAIPVNMEFDHVSQLYMTQIAVPEYSSVLADGTTVTIKGLKANLFLDISERVKEIGALKREIQDEEDALKQDQKNGVIPENIKKYNALHPFHKVAYKRDADKNPIGIDFEPLNDKIEIEKAQCGFFGSLMYKQDKTAKEALADYKARDEHEKNFNQMKNQMKFNLQRNSSQDGKEGRSLILFVGLIAVSVLRQAWINSDEMQRSYESTYDMLDEMESIRRSWYADGSSHTTTFTSKQVDIAMAAGVDVPLEWMTPSVREQYERKLHPKKRGRKSKQVTAPEE